MPPSLIGRPAPDFALSSISVQDRTTRLSSLSAYAGRWLILMFYPRDFSFVCPTELTAFSAQIDAFRSRDCDILAVSVDSVDDHLRWFETPVERGGIGPLRFPLGADPGGECSRAYGVWMEDHGFAARGLFIIDPAGILQYSVTHNASVGRSSEETLRVLDALQSGGLCPASWTLADGTINAEEQLHAGRVLGHFRIVEQLGAGAFGTVFAAEDLVLDRRVALKIIGRNADVARDAILAEARAAAKLNHPNICTIFTVETIDAVPVIVMEYIDGQPLSDFGIAGSPIETRLRIALGIASGLADAHAHGVVHGDLKPANVMVAQSGEAKLLDFGLAKRIGPFAAGTTRNQPAPVSEVSDSDATVIADVEPAAGTGETLRLSGTPAYMAPEQTLGSPPSFKSDVYAFGLILVELLTGRPVVRGDNLFRVLAQIQSGAARRSAIASVPGAFREMISSLLAPGPEDRPESLTAVRLLMDRRLDSRN